MCCCFHVLLSQDLVVNCVACCWATIARLVSDLLRKLSEFIVAELLDSVVALGQALVMPPVRTSVPGKSVQIRSPKAIDRLDNRNRCSLGTGRVSCCPKRQMERKDRALRTPKAESLGNCIGPRTGTLVVEPMDPKTEARP